MGISILPPDVNLSDHEFVVVDGNIRFGLDAVKGVGYAAVEAIKRARRRTDAFRDLWDFCARVDGRAVNKKAIEALIKCGAFGSTGAIAQGHAVGARAGPGRGPEGPAGRADRPGIDLRPGPRARDGCEAVDRRRRQRRRVRHAEPRADPDERVRSRRAARRREGGDRPVHLRPPAQGGRRGARAKRRLRARRAVRPPRRRLGHGRRDDHAGEANQDQEGRSDDVRDARRSRRRRSRWWCSARRSPSRDALDARLDRARPRPRRPQGPREDVHRRPADRAVRARPPTRSGPPRRGGRRRPRRAGALRLRLDASGAARDGARRAQGAARRASPASPTS